VFRLAGIAILGFVVWMPPGTPAAATSVQALPAPLRIVAFGDSLTSGHRLPKSDAYPAVLERALNGSGVRAVVVNHGISGDTSARGLRRLDRTLAEEPQILIIAFGANDGLRGVPVGELKSNLARMIEAAQARGARVLLVGMEALPLYGFQYSMDFHRVYPDLAAAHRVPLVPFMLTGVLGNRDLMSADGIHPNASGARAIAETVLPHVRAMIEPPAVSH
jgi:acyl-CoA thioesterase-1